MLQLLSEWVILLAVGIFIYIIEIKEAEVTSICLVLSLFICSTVIVSKQPIKKIEEEEREKILKVKLEKYCSR